MGFRKGLQKSDFVLRPRHFNTLQKLSRTRKWIHSILISLKKNKITVFFCSYDCFSILANFASCSQLHTKQPFTSPVKAVTEHKPWAYPLPTSTFGKLGNPSKQPKSYSQSWVDVVPEIHRVAPGAATNGNTLSPPRGTACARQTMVRFCKQPGMLLKLLHLLLEIPQLLMQVGT